MPANTTRMTSAGRRAPHPGPRRTPGWRTLLFCVALSAACATPLAQPATLMGTWEYRQTNSASPTGVDAEGERLVFRRAADGQLVVHYFGLERR